MNIPRIIAFSIHTIQKIAMSLPTVPFADFAPRTPLSNPLRAAITAATRRPEPEALAPVMAQASLYADLAASAQEVALRIAPGVGDR